MPLPVTSELDPYTQVYNLLCNKVRESVAVRKIITREANIVSFSEGHGQDVVREQPKEADLPEILIRASNIAGNLNEASNGASLIRSYRLVVSTSTGTITTKLFPLEWAVTCALTTFQFDAALRSLEWNGSKFVKSVRFDGADSGESAPEVNRGIQGWAAIWRMNVQMAFTHHAMTDFNNTALLNGDV